MVYKGEKYTPRIAKFYFLIQTNLIVSVSQMYNPLPKSYDPFSASL